MAIKMELGAAVSDQVRHRLTAAERASFFARLDAVRTEPIGNSEACHDPEAGPYMMRFFRFGPGDRWLAVFEYDIARERIKVTQCRLLNPGRRFKRGQNGERSAR